MNNSHYIKKNHKRSSAGFLSSLPPSLFHLPPSSRGFTLVELIVSLGLFVIVIVAAVSSLASVNTAARKVEAMRSVLDNLNFAIESMSRTIRTGTQITCGAAGSASDCSFFTDNSSSQISLEKTIGVDETVTFRHWVVNNNGEIQKCTGGNCVALTAPGIDVESLRFYVDGAPVGDSLQPAVRMIVAGTATAGGNIAPFVIQTTVSVRTVE